MDKRIRIIRDNQTNYPQPNTNLPIPNPENHRNAPIYGPNFLTYLYLNIAFV